MKVLIACALVLSAADAHAKASALDYPSCDLETQHGVKGDAGGSITDPRQARISVRANIIEADLGTARRARHLTQATTDLLYKRVEAVRAGADRYTKRQGFLSAGEAASYDRELDTVAMQVCRRAVPSIREATESDRDYLQHRAVTLKDRIDTAVRKRNLTRRQAVNLRLAVGQVQTEAGHLQTVNGTISRPDADRMNQRLTDVERTVTHQP